MVEGEVGGPAAPGASDARGRSESRGGPHIRLRGGAEGRIFKRLKQKLVPLIEGKLAALLGQLEQRLAGGASGGSDTRAAAAAPPPASRGGDIVRVGGAQAEAALSQLGAAISLPAAGRLSELLPLSGLGGPARGRGFGDASPAGTTGARGGGGAGALRPARVYLVEHFGVHGLHTTLVEGGGDEEGELFLGSGGRVGLTSRFAKLAQLLAGDTWEDFPHALAVFTSYAVFSFAATTCGERMRADGAMSAAAADAYFAMLGAYEDLFRLTLVQLRAYDLAATWLMAWLDRGIRRLLRIGQLVAWPPAVGFTRGETGLRAFDDLFDAFKALRSNVDMRLRNGEVCHIGGALLPRYEAPPGSGSAAAAATVPVAPPPASAATAGSGRSLSVAATRGGREGAGISGSARHAAPSLRRRFTVDGVCFNFNQGRECAPTAKGADGKCRFKHVCGICGDAGHKGPACPKL